MPHLEDSFLEKLDAQLVTLLTEGELDANSRVPVVIRCEIAALPSISASVERLGGRIRHHLRLLGALAVWMPLARVADLVQSTPLINSVELEQEFIVA